MIPSHEILAPSHYISAPAFADVGLSDVNDRTTGRQLCSYCYGKDDRWWGRFLSLCFGCQQSRGRPPLPCDYCSGCLCCSCNSFHAQFYWLGSWGPWPYEDNDLFFSHPAQWMSTFHQWMSLQSIYVHRSIFQSSMCAPCKTWESILASFIIISTLSQLLMINGIGWLKEYIPVDPNRLQHPIAIPVKRRRFHWRLF